jgi:hypothetical protein
VGNDIFDSPVIWDGSLSKFSQVIAIALSRGISRRVDGPADDLATERAAHDGAILVANTALAKEGSCRRLRSARPSPP